MEIGNDDLDFMNDEYDIDSESDLQTQNNEDQIDDYQSDDDYNHHSNDYSESDDQDFISELLKTRGIEDKTKIKFENEYGEIEEVDWDSLTNRDKLNILHSSEDDSTSLEDQEIMLINAIRQSQLTPQEYLRAVQNQSVNQYLQYTQDQFPTYRVDEISDEELFISDLLSRTPDLTEDEAYEALDRIKQNEALFNKQIGAIRAEYKKAEDDAIYYSQARKQQMAQEQFNHFADSIGNSIVNFTEFSGCDINMDEEDMQNLYEFITGVDAAGVSHFGKVLNDPEWLVRMAWFALNGEQMINDINEYYKKEIANVRKESYNRGLQGKDKTTVVHKNIQRNNTSKDYDDLDDFN